MEKIKGFQISSMTVSGFKCYEAPMEITFGMMQSLPRFPKPSRTRPSHLYSSLSRGMQSNRNSFKGNAQSVPLKF